MNIETIRRIIREEIETALTENVDILVDYDTFERVIIKAMTQAGVKDVQRWFNNDPIERCYHNLKQEIGELGPRDQHEMPSLVHFYAHDMTIDILATSRVPEDLWKVIADRVADYLVGEVSDVDSGSASSGMRFE